MKGYEEEAEIAPQKRAAKIHDFFLGIPFDEGAQEKTLTEYITFSIASRIHIFGIVIHISKSLRFLNFSY